MSEFSTKAAPVPPPVEPHYPQETSQHWLKRPLLFGLSIPWIALCVLIVIAAVWYLFVPASTPSVNRLAFGEQDLQPTSQSLNFAPAGQQSLPDVNLSQIQDQVAAMVGGVRSHSEANREAIEQLAGTVRGLIDADSKLKQQVSELQAQVALYSAQRPAMPTKPAAHATAHKISKSPASTDRAAGPLDGMRRVSVQNGMAWVFYQDKTWAVQVGDSLGPVTVTSIDAKAQQIHTSAGILK
jgi:intracellular multiplication protein IcmG